MESKILIGMVTLLLLSGVVSAYNVDCDGPGWFNSDLCRDYELQEEFDAVQADVDDNEALGKKALNKAKNAKKTAVKAKSLALDNKEVIKTNKDAWAVDNKGISARDMSYYLFGNEQHYFIHRGYAVEAWVNSWYESKLEKIENDNDYLRAELFLLKEAVGASYDRAYIAEQAAIEKSRRTGNPVTFGSKTCTVHGCA